MATTKMSPVLQGLAAATGTDPYATDQWSLDARARRRGEESALQADADWQDQQFNPENPYFGMNRNMLMQRPNLLQSHSPWDAWLESVQEAGDRAGGGVKLGEIPGLTSEDRLGPFAGTLPLSLQGLQGAQYAYSPGGRPIGIRTGR